jgi:hypothetical protein
MATLAMEEWRRVEAAAAALPASQQPRIGSSSPPLWNKCGTIDMGDASASAELATIIDVARSDPSGAFEVLSGAEIRARWTGLAGVPLEWSGVFNREGGVLTPDVAVPTLHALAVASGTTLIDQSPVVGVREVPCAGRSCEVRLSDGTLLGASRVVIAAGAWVAPLLQRAVSPPPCPALAMEVWEISWAWYRLRKDAAAKSAATALPAWRAFAGAPSGSAGAASAAVAQSGGSSTRIGRGFYGFPVHDRSDAVKIAGHGHSTIGRFSAPEERAGRPSAAFVAQTSAFAAATFDKLLEEGGGEELEPHTCLYVHAARRVMFSLRMRAGAVRGSVCQDLHS